MKAEDRYDKDSSDCLLKGLIAVWVTKIAHPFGGGEAFFYQCARWATEFKVAAPRSFLAY